MKNTESDRERDDFWNLSSLVPQKARPRVSKSVTDTRATEIALPDTKSARPYRVEEAVLTEHYVTPQAMPKNAPVPALVYAPQHSLIHEVRVYPWRTQYEYYEPFRRHARALLSREGVNAPRVEFFSYMPQYSQMNGAQLAYYLWWRTNFRKGIALPADYSYLLLYLYELINTGDVGDPQESLDTMARLWLSYREEHPRLDPLVREWLCDYALLHQLSAPSLPVSQYRALLAGSRLKEFFVPMDGKEDAIVSAVILFCNNYDYTKSKFFTEETAGDYHRALKGAVRVAIDYMRERDGNLLTGGGGVSTISRDTFTGAICSYHLKRRIEVDYTSFSHTHELRYIMSDVLKYAENALRAARGIKSRLTIYAVEVPLRERLDAYLAEVLPKKSPRVAAKRVEEIPEYERRYELPRSAPTAARAAEIEMLSWETTRALVEAFGEEETEDEQSFAPRSISEPEVAKEQPPISPLNDTRESKDHSEENGSSGSPFAAALGVLLPFVRLADGGSAAAQRELARELGRMTDAIADEINAIAGDILGDIILEEKDGAYAVIEEYREMLVEEGVLTDGK